MYYLEFSKTSKKINNQWVQNNQIIKEHVEGVVNEDAQVLSVNLLRDVLRVQDPPEPRLCENYRVNFNTIESEGPIVLPPLPPRNEFVVTSSLMKMLTLFPGMSLEDPHGYMAKLRSVCKSCIGRPELDMNIIRLRVLPLSLTIDVVVWFSKLAYNSINTWEQLHTVFM